MHPGPHDTFVFRKIVKGAWNKWFAWRPVKIHGNRVWFKTVYRRQVITYVDMDDWARYEYGTVFDILKHSQ
jgi:Fe-S cluster biosynthesis and repair protein YggX